jgi:uncharacterized protein (DUF1800 family)
MNRAGFGGTPEEIQKLHALGQHSAVEFLLQSGEDLDLFPPPELELMSPKMRKIRVLEAGQEQKDRQLAAVRASARENGLLLRHWWLNRMRETPNPVREKATLFWHGHWATSIKKVKDPFLMHQQNETLRAYALGPFAPMAKEITRDPAMMRYLDLHTSSVKNPNENFAREVLELFTLGEGHYSEDDIAAAARAFTGYRINRETGRFEFNAHLADDGPKSFMGVTGSLGGDDVLDIVLGNPQCPEFLAAKLWTFYAGRPPSDNLQKLLGEEYRRCGMNTGLFLRAMFNSRDFFSTEIVRHQIKSPVQWIVQMCKILELPLPELKKTQQLLANLGQNLFDPPNVKGWDGGRAWISSSTLLVRYNAAGNMLRGAAGEMPPLDNIVPPTLSPEAMAETLSWRLFQAPLPLPLHKRTMAFVAENGTSAAARRDLVHLLMSTPEFQLT